MPTATSCPFGPFGLALALTLPACTGGATPEPARAPPTEERLLPASTVPAPRKPPAAPRCEAKFHVFDGDDDGVVDWREFDSRPHGEADVARTFRERDRDGDSVLTETEFCFEERVSEPERGSVGNDVGRNPIPPETRAGGDDALAPNTEATVEGPRCAQHFQAFDTDGDGQLNYVEFAAMPDARGDPDALFSEYDTDHDGAVIQAELCGPGS